MALDLKKIVSIDFPVDQYYAVPTKKKQIVLHHTVSGVGVSGDVNHWLSDSARVATSIIISRDGTIHQCFSTKYWAHHLGIKTGAIREAGTSKSNLELNQHSVGIELDSYGGLVKKGKSFVTVYGNKVAAKDVVEYKEPYRGYSAYEKYTTKQIAALKDLLVYLCDKYSIKFGYNKDMFDVSKDALNGVEGIWSHTSYRSDKSDIHPQKELISMLKGAKAAPKAKAKKAPAKSKAKKDAKSVKK